MAYRSSAIASAATGAITATPAGVQVGDYLGGLFTTDSALATVSLPSGWVQRANIIHPASTPDGESTWYADKVAAGSDSFQFNDNSSSNRSLVTAAWSGRDTTNPRSTAPVTTTNTTANGNPFTATYNGITASDGDDVGIFFFGDQTTAADRFVTAPPTNYTERQDGVNQDWVAAIGLDTRDNVNAGATGNFTSGWTVGPGFTGYGAVVVAIARAAAITDQPADATAQAGDTASFSVTASGAPTYQWQIFDALVDAWVDIGGATASSYTTPTLTRAEHGDMYRCVLDGGAETSTAATLRVTEIPASYSGIGLVVGDSCVGEGMLGGPLSVGGGNVTGTATATEAPDTASASGTVKVTGTAAASEAADSAAASGNVLIPTGTGAASEAADTSSAAGLVRVTGTAVAAEAADTSSASGTATVTGSAAVSEAADTSSAAGLAKVTGTAAAAEAADTLSASGSATNEPTGAGAATEAADTASGSGTVRVTGAAAANEAADTATASGSVVVQPTGTGAATEAADTSSGAGLVVVTGTAIAAEAADSSSAAGTVRILGAAAASEAFDTVSGVGSVIDPSSVFPARVALSERLVGSVLISEKAASVARSERLGGSVLSGEKAASVARSEAAVTRVTTGENA